MTAYKAAYQNPAQVLQDRQEEVAAVREGNLDELLMSRIEKELP